MCNLEFPRAYLDDLLVISKGTYAEHLEHLEIVLVRLSETGLKVNVTKSSFCKPELEYLGFWINRKVIQPLTKKVDAILNIVTDHVCKITFKMPLFNKHRDITWRSHVDPADHNLCKYNLIIGRDLLLELGIPLQFSKASIIWDNAEITMQQPGWFETNNVNSFEEELFMAHDPESTDANRIQRIIDLKYK